MYNMGTVGHNIEYNFKYPFDVIRTDFNIPNTEVNDVK